MKGQLYFITAYTSDGGQCSGSGDKLRQEAEVSSWVLYPASTACMLVKTPKFHYAEFLDNRLKRSVRIDKPFGRAVLTASVIGLRLRSHRHVYE